MRIEYSENKIIGELPCKARALFRESFKLSQIRKVNQTTQELSKHKPKARPDDRSDGLVSSALCSLEHLGD